MYKFSIYYPDCCGIDNVSDSQLVDIIAETIKETKIQVSAVIDSEYKSINITANIEASDRQACENIEYAFEENLIFYFMRLKRYS